MKISKRGICVAMAALFASNPAAARAEPTADQLASVLRLDDAGGPGCAVAVTQDGKQVLAAGYGQAIVEAGTPITPRTEFHIASVSKQFTAFAILLLEREGKLSLSDDVRKHLPEFQSGAAVVTVDDLLHHTSGVRDEWMTFLQGYMPEDSITQPEVLRAIYAQRSLNDAPGLRFAYANSNYTLLAAIVEKATGKAFPAVMKERVFDPLGMTGTYVRDNARLVRPRAAHRYGSGPAGLEHRESWYSAYGSSNIYTTAEDIARWMGNFETPVVGDRVIVAKMAEAVRDASVVPATYGRGLEVGAFSGVSTLEHGGIAPGSAAYMLVLPELGLGVSLLCNLEINDTRRLARDAAALYLGDRYRADPARRPPEIPRDQLDRFVGTYREKGGAVFDVSVRNGRLYMQGQDPLIPISPDSFRLESLPIRFSFRGSAGSIDTLVIHDPDQDRHATRIELRPSAPLSSRDAAQFAGRYYSEDLAAVLSVEQRRGQLWLVGAGFETPLLQPPEPARQDDVFFTPSPVGGLEFERGRDGRVTGLAITNPRVVSLRFSRLDVAPRQP